MNTPKLMKKFSDEAYQMGRRHELEEMLAILKNKISKINNGRTPKTATRKTVVKSKTPNRQRKSPA